MILTLKGPDEYLERLRTARGSAAVLKMRLAKVRSSLGVVPILAFEGDDDKIVYYQWIRRICPSLTYEPFVCSGKSGVLTLHEVLVRDMSGLRENTFLFIDRDFDDERGVELADFAFMTDNYSVENYLVSRDVLDLALKNEFHCHGEVDMRNRIADLFDTAYRSFLEVSQPANRRLFLARRVGIELNAVIPSQISRVGDVRLNDCGASTYPLDRLISCVGDIEAVSNAELEEEFSRMVPSERYRGKFALAFFLRWLTILADEFSAPGRGVFKGLQTASNARTTELTLSNLASKSKLPAGLLEFVEKIAA